MNQSLNIHYARARQDEIQRLISGRETVDEWQPAPPGRWIDRMGRSLVHLGIRLISDRQVADRIESHLSRRAA